MSFFKKLRFFFRLLREFLKKWLFLIIIGIISGSVFYYFLPRLLVYLPKLKKAEKIGILGRFTLEEIPSEILSKISLGLTKVLPDGTILPDLADRFEVSSDAKIYTFYFESKKIWHDGTTFKAEDVNYNFKDAKIIPAGNLIKIRLNEPFSPFLATVSEPLFKKGLVGLGDYKVKKVERIGPYLKTIFLSSNGKENLPDLIYRFYSNETYLKTAFKLGEINKIEEINNVDEFTSWPNIQISKILFTDRTLTLFLNVSKEPFSDKSFRQAVAYSLNKRDDKSRSVSPISSYSWFFNPGVKKYEKDLSKSKLLLSKLKLPPESKFILATFPSLESEAKEIKEDLLSVGIQTEIKFVTTVQDDFDLFLAIQKFSKDPDQYLFWHSGQPLNISHFSNPRIDKLLEDGRKIYDPQERKKIYFDFQRFLVEESPAIFLNFPTYFSIERS